MNRRVFLKASVISFSLITGVGLYYQFNKNLKYELVLFSMITNKIEDLGLCVNKKGLQQYCFDYFSYNDIRYKEKIGFHLYSSVFLSFVPKSFYNKLDQFIERRTEQYLLSTNLSTIKKTFPLEYVSYYDPYISYCSNPFAKLRSLS